MHPSLDARNMQAKESGSNIFVGMLIFQRFLSHTPVGTKEVSLQGSRFPEIIFLEFM